VQILVTIG